MVGAGSSSEVRYSLLTSAIRYLPDIWTAHTSQTEPREPPHFPLEATKSPAPRCFPTSVELKA